MKAPTLLLLADNLLTTTRISETARAAGVAVETVRSSQAVQRCRELQPALILVDLEATADMPAVVAKLRAATEPRRARLIGFHPHVRTDLRDAALAAGLDEAWPRSALQVRLPPLLRAAAATAS